MTVLDYSTPVAKKWRFHWIHAAVIVGIILLLISILLPSLCRAREPANRVKCSSNVRQIGQAILLYANDNGGNYPDMLEQVLATQDITAECFVCPSSNDEKAPGDTPQEMAKNLSAGHHLSYIYLGKALTTHSPPETPVLYEPIDNHDNDGSNVLFVDGHVEWFNRKELAKLPGVTLPASTAAR